MVLFFIIWYKSMYLQSLPALTLFGTQRVLRACGTRLAPTEPEARPQVQILSHRLIKKRIVRKNGSLFYYLVQKYVPSISSGTNAVRDAEGAACLWHAFSTDRAGGETASSNLVASTNKEENRS